MKLEPAWVLITEWSRKLRSSCTSGAIWDPYVAVAIKQTGALLGVLDVDVLLDVVAGAVTWIPTLTE